jgi:hypothetical protein
VSIAAPSRSRTWVLLASGLAAVLVAFGVVVFLSLPGERVISPGTPVTESGTPIVEQAPWSFEVSPAGSTSRISKAQRAAVVRQKAGVTALVQEVYDALLFERAALTKVADERFAGDAGAAFIRASKGILPAADELKLERRSARIGIDVDGANRAAARIRIRVSATKGGREALALNTATLWLERSEKGWRVFAYEIDQRPFTPKPNEGSGKGSKGSKPGGKKG